MPRGIDSDALSRPANAAGRPRPFLPSVEARPSPFCAGDESDNATVLGRSVESGNIWRLAETNPSRTHNREIHPEDPLAPTLLA